MNVKLTISGQGLEYSSDITLQQAGRVIAFVAGAENLPTSESYVEPKNGIPKKPASSAFESPRQAIEQTKAVTNPQKIVALALFNGATSDNQVTFAPDEIKPLFAKAGEATPKNIGRDFKEALKAGYVHEEAEGRFRLLRVTDQAVLTGFEKVKRSSSPVRRKSKEAGEKMVVRQEIGKLPVSADLDGFANFWSLKSRSLKIIWILKFAETHGIDTLNRLEIIAVANRLGEKLSTRNIAAALDPVEKSGDVHQPSEGQYKLSQKAETRIKPVADES